MITRKTNVKIKNSFPNLTIIALFLIILSGCATYQSNVGPTQIKHAQKEIPEDQLMDVGMLTFESDEISEKEAKEEGTSNELEKQRVILFPIILKTHCTIAVTGVPCG